MRLPQNYLAPRIPLDRFVPGWQNRALGEAELLRMILVRAKETWPTQEMQCWIDERRGGDPFHDVDLADTVVVVSRLLRVVERSTDSERQVDIATLPVMDGYVHCVGDLWYENVLFVVVPGWLRPRRRLETEGR